MIDSIDSFIHCLTDWHLNYKPLLCPPCHRDAGPEFDESKSKAAVLVSKVSQDRHCTSLLSFLNFTFKSITSLITSLRSSLQFYSIHFDFYDQTLTSPAPSLQLNFTALKSSSSRSIATDRLIDWLIDRQTDSSRPRPMAPVSPKGGIKRHDSTVMGTIWHCTGTDTLFQCSEFSACLSSVQFSLLLTCSSAARDKVNWLPTGKQRHWIAPRRMQSPDRVRSLWQPASST